MRNLIHVLVADTPIHVADGNPIEIAPEDLADFLGCIAVRDLGSARFDERAVPAQLGHASLKGTARARAAEEEQHRQHLIAQVGMRFVQSALALQIKGHIQHGLHFFLAEVEIAD